MPTGVLPHYLLVCCLTIGHLAIPSGVVPHHQPCLLVWFLTIDHASWRGTSLYAMPSGQLPLQSIFYLSSADGRRVVISLVLPVQRCHYIRHVWWSGATLRYACLYNVTISDMHAGFMNSSTHVCKVLLYQARYLVCYKSIRHAYR